MLQVIKIRVRVWQKNFFSCLIMVLFTIDARPLFSVTAAKLRDKFIFIVRLELCLNPDCDWNGKVYSLLKIFW